MEPHIHASRWMAVRWGAIAGLLLFPAVAMRFTDEVNWSAFDFVAAAALLGSMGLAYEIAARRLRSAGPRRLVAAVILGAGAVIWAQGAVGIF